MRRSSRQSSRAAALAPRLSRRGAIGVGPVTTRFEMRSTRKAVAPAVERVLEAVEGAALNPDQRDDLAVAVAEALSNAAVHGNRLHADRPVSVTVEVTPNHHAVVEVEDGGGGFDVASVSDPTDPKHLLVPGGRGVFLMRRLVDRLEYNASGNRVRLTAVRRPGTPRRRTRLR